MARKVKALYVYGDGAIVKLNRTAMQQVVDGAWYTQAPARRELAARQNHTTGTWTHLPKALYASERGVLGAWMPGYECMSYDDIDASEVAYLLGRS